MQQVCCFFENQFCYKHEHAFVCIDYNIILELSESDDKDNFIVIYV